MKRKGKKGKNSMGERNERRYRKGWHLRRGSKKLAGQCMKEKEMKETMKQKKKWKEERRNRKA